MKDFEASTQNDQRVADALAFFSSLTPEERERRAAGSRQSNVSHEFSPKVSASLFAHTEEKEPPEER